MLAARTTLLIALTACSLGCPTKDAAPSSESKPASKQKADDGGQAKADPAPTQMDEPDDAAKSEAESDSKICGAFYELAVRDNRKVGEDGPFTPERSSFVPLWSGDLGAWLKDSGAEDAPPVVTRDAALEAGGSEVDGGIAIGGGPSERELMLTFDADGQLKSAENYEHGGGRESGRSVWLYREDCKDLPPDEVLAYVKTSKAALPVEPSRSLADDLGDGSVKAESVECRPRERDQWDCNISKKQMNYNFRVKRSPAGLVLDGDVDVTED